MGAMRRFIALLAVGLVAAGCASGGNYRDGYDVSTSTAADLGNGNAAVSGEVVPGAMTLRSATGPVLEDMFLIDQPEPNAHPARFQGSASVAAQGSTQPPRDRPLDGGNVALTPAERCP